VTPARVIVPVLALSLATACGGGSSDKSPTAGGADSVTAVDSGDVQTATIRGTDSLRFAPSTVKAKPGVIEITFDVTGNIAHAFEAKGIAGASIDNVAGHEKKSVKFTAVAGTYQLICSFHSGMRGSLVVAP